MTAKEYLLQARMIDVKIRAKRAQIKHLEEVAESATISFAANFDDARVQGGQPKNKVLDYAVMASDLTQELREDIRRLLRIKREIGKVIKRIQDDRYRTVLEFYYLSHMSWKQVAEKMNYCERHVRRLHSKALKTLGSKRFKKMS